ncbi:MAG TPA: regulatory protein RecX [Clostridiaceae bacterium]|nr:regulatory protein RecX [Clostridiaceae bacterium]
MKITRIERIGKKKDKYLIYIDGERSFSIREEDYFKLNLYEKKEVTQEELELIRNDILYNSARSAAIRYVSLMLRCESEVRNKLKTDGYEQSTIDKVIEDLKSLGYINDKLYAQKYVYDRMKLKPKSKRLLRFELQKRGISTEDIEEVLSDFKMNEQDIIESLIKRKFGKYDLNDPKIYKRAFSFLVYRGFNTELINEVLNKMK